MITFKLEEDYDGLVHKMELSTGEVFSDYTQLVEWAKNLDERVIIYGSGLSELAVGLGGMGVKVRFWSWTRSGRILKIQIGKAAMVEISQWDFADAEDEVIEQNLSQLEETHGKIMASPASAVSSSFAQTMGYEAATKRTEERPSLIEAYLCSSRLPDRYFRPAYSGGMLGSPADPSRIYEEVSSFDISSSYPFSAVTTMVPRSQSVEIADEDLASIQVNSEGKLDLGENVGFIGLFTVKNFRRKEWVRLPMLREADEKFIRDLKTDRIGVVSGSIQMAMTPPELEQFCMQFDYEDIIIESLSIHALGYIPGRARYYILQAFDKKNKLEKGDPDREVAKTALNTLIGFWGTDQFHAMVTKRYDAETGGTIEEYKGSLADNFAVYAGTDEKVGVASGKARQWDFRWACYALASARLRITKAEKACYDAGLEVLYSDTDSMKVNGPREVAVEVFEKLSQEARELEDYEGLGTWTDETDGFTRGVFRALKCYVLERPTGVRAAKAAGVKPMEALESVKDYTIEEMVEDRFEMKIHIRRRTLADCENEILPFGFKRVYALRDYVLSY